MQVNLLNDKFVIIGAGDTGRSILAYLNHHHAQVLRVLDTRINPPQLGAVPVIGGELKSLNLVDADVIVISPGVSIYEPVIQEAIRQGKKIVGDIELFAQAISHWSSQVVAITGSNGKTTVTSLCGFIANECGKRVLVAGNIGTPVLDAWLAIEQTRDYPEIIVLELSSFQLETTHSLQIAAATVLNISEDHLDRYRDLLEYAYVKANIFNNAKVQVLNQDDPLVTSMIRHDLEQVFFAHSNAEYSLITEDGATYLGYRGNKLLNTNQLQLVGRHNYMNVLATLGLLAAVGINHSEALEAACLFAGLEHRMQKVIEHNGILYIEDSKGTNVGAVIAGVNGIDRPVHLILGGDGKGQDFTPLRQLVLDKCHSVAVIGQDADLILRTLAGITNVQKLPSLEEAVRTCIANAKTGDAVILSPACASWDMFDNYKHRAQVFIDTVHEYIK